ncbi:MAG: hypothetical protein ACTHKC_06210 [Candidatus Nitrosocosmicus sp.]
MLPSIYGKVDSFIQTATSNRKTGLVLFQKAATYKEGCMSLTRSLTI